MFNCFHRGNHVSKTVFEWYSSCIEVYVLEFRLRRKAVVALYVEADVSPKPTLDRVPQVANPTTHINEGVAADVSLFQYSVYHRVDGFGTRASSRARLRL